MALATQCPHCGTTFRVASDQLKLRGGIVRCGSCQEIFDGNASLVDLDAPAAQQAAAPTPAPEPEAVVDDAPAAAPVAADAEPEPAAPADEETVYTLDLHSTLDPAGILPEPEAEVAEPEAHAEPEVRLEPGAHAEPEAQPEPEVHAEAEVQPVHEEAEPQTGPELHAEAQAVPEAEVHDEAEPHAEPEPRADEEPKPIFGMGSALLEEPEPIAKDTRAEPLLDLQVDEELVAAPLPDSHDDRDEAALTAHTEAVLHAAQHAPLPMRESADISVTTPSAYGKPPRSKLTGRRSKLTPTRIAPPKLRVPDIDEPEFVKRGRQKEQAGKRRMILMGLGCAVLVLALAAQAVTTFRDVLAARFPAARPALATACSVLGCRIELPARIENLTIETGELQTLGPNTYALSTLLHNQGNLVQAWPSIELALTDANDKPVLRRVFGPAEYLPQGVSAPAGFGARAEQPVKLYFRLDQLKPSGYRIAVFYP